MCATLGVMSKVGKKSTRDGPSYAAKVFEKALEVLGPHNKDVRELATKLDKIVKEAEYAKTIDALEPMRIAAPKRTKLPDPIPLKEDHIVPEGSYDYDGDDYSRRCEVTFASLSHIWDGKTLERGNPVPGDKFSVEDMVTLWKLDRSQVRQYVAVRNQSMDRLGQVARFSVPKWDAQLPGWWACVAYGPMGRTTDATDGVPVRIVDPEPTAI